jgi:magnesium transporter
MNWIGVYSPSQEDIKNICLKYALDEDDIQDALDVDELSRTSSNKDYDTIIIRVPTKKSITAYRAIPIGIFLPSCEKDTIITICLENSEVFSKISKIIDSIKSPSEFVLNLLSFSAILYIKYLKEMDKESTIIQHALEESVNNKYLTTLFSLEKSLVYFTTALKSNQILIKKLSIRYTSIDTKELIEDSSIDNEQALSMAETNSGILSGMMDAYASCISNNLNVRIKTMTLISLILMIPTLIASILGSNFNTLEWNSFVSYQFAPPIVIGGSFIIAGISWWLFTRRKI